jgi:spore coat polysaccharide biosynthesis protein SpsF
MKTVAIIQARMDSTRLPGKVMLSLNCTPIIQHVTRRVSSCELVDEVVVATTDKRRDDIVDDYAQREGADVFRGDESDVLRRVFRAAESHGAKLVVRITADNPLTPPSAIDTTIEKVQNSGHDYISNKINRSFPAGFDTEVCTFESLEMVDANADTQRDREHVTTYYRRSEAFDTANISSAEVYSEPRLQNRTELRLTLDTPADFELFTRLYENVPYDGILDIGDAIRYIDKQDLATLNVK